MKGAQLLKNGVVIFFALGLVVGCSNDEEDDEAESVTHTVTEEGGVVESDDGKMALEFPAGAVSEDAQLTITEEERPDRDDLYTELYRFEFDGSLEKDVTLSIELDEEPEGAEMRLANFDGEQPTAVPGSTVENGAVVGDLTGFSYYGGFDVGAESSDYESESTIDASGGVATSADGNFSIDFPAGAFDGEADVTIINLTQQMAAEGTVDDSGYDTDSYMVMASIEFDLVEELGAAATVTIDVDATGDQSGRLIGMGQALGIIAGSELEGGTITGEVVDISDGPFGGVVFEITERCEAIDAYGATCGDEDDCSANVGAGDDWYECVCNDGDVTVGFSCHGEVCESVLGSCAGIGLGHEGHCDDSGGWAGDCYHEE